VPVLPLYDHKIVTSMDASFAGQSEDDFTTICVIPAQPISMFSPKYHLRGISMATEILD
jgi:hypothetical protein